MSYAGSIAFAAAVYVAMGVYDFCVIPFTAAVLQPKLLPDRAPRYQKFDTRDHVYIFFGKLLTALFFYHSYLVITGDLGGGIGYDFTDVDAMVTALWRMPLHFLFLFVVYDFVYMLFHWALHWAPLYPLIHKHHHRNMTPFRGSTDAMNVHPIEYFVGEYNHLLAFWLLSRVVGGTQLHALTFVLFVFFGGALASLNHTRMDIRVPFIYNVNAHDFHHRQYRCNYGCYSMLWDCVFGTFMPYTEEFVANPKQE